MKKLFVKLSTVFVFIVISMLLFSCGDKECPHTNKRTVKENEVAASCTLSGSYDEIEYCDDCNAELSREGRSEDAYGHDYKNEKCTRCGIGTPSQGLEYKLKGDGTCYVSGIGTCEDTEVVIPSATADGWIVTGIGDSAFSNCRGLVSVNIPDGVTYIGDSAFSGCMGLVSVNIPDGVTYIGDSAFSYCVGLVSIEMPDSVEIVGDSAFFFCYSLTSVVLSDSMVEIGSFTFERCASLTSITIPDSVKIIFRHAFSDCSSLTSIVIGSGIFGIDYDAFGGCYRLAEVINKSSLSIIAGSSKNGEVAKYAKTVHTEKSTVKIVDDYIFFTDKNGINYLVGYLGSDIAITLPENYNGEKYAINDNAFINCKTLLSVVIGDNVTGIGKNAFEGCSGLTSVVIGDSVKDIGDSAFKDCIRLTSIKIGNGVTDIGAHAFEECSGLTSVVLGDGVTSIGNYAFYWCSELASIVIGNGVTSIDFTVFENCNALSDVYYRGTEEEWNAIKIYHSGELQKATKHYKYTD